MKLSNLVAYLNLLENLKINEAQVALSNVLDPVRHSIITNELQFGDCSRRIENLYQKINGDLGGINTVIHDLQQHIRSEIEKSEPYYLQQSYDLYYEGMRYDSVEHMLNRRFYPEPEVSAHIKSRISRHSDWRYPGMILRPGLEDWIYDLVALDPIYLVDTDHAMLDPSISGFPSEYQRRTCRHVIKESTDTTMLHDLPQDQIAFVLAYNYFNYRPMEMIRCMLKEMFQCIRSGGTLAFTFNDCDRAGGVEMAERCYMCYTPGRLVLAAADMLGFQITHVYRIDSAITWVELKKPGELHSYRGGQALARIVEKNQKS